MRGAACFVTGTDTGVGKTRVACALLRGFRAGGRRAVGMKPVASGCTQDAGAWRNADALALLANSDPRPEYAQVNPYALPEAVAPQFAAAALGVEIALAPIQQALTKLQTVAERIVIEGVGGWCVPLSESLMQADLVRALRVPVILVVGLRLGCINHALLSSRAIALDGCRLVGWVGSVLESDMARLTDNLATLTTRLPAPCLGVLPYEPIGDALAESAALSLQGWTDTGGD